MREISEVINKIRAEIPDLPKHLEIFRYLEYIKKTSFYTPPEMICNLWNALAVFLTDAFGNNALLLKDWQFNIVRIFIDKPNVSREEIQRNLD